MGDGPALLVHLGIICRENSFCPYPYLLLEVEVIYVVCGRLCAGKYPQLSDWLPVVPYELVNSFANYMLVTGVMVDAL
ncbi:MAG: hypothetical protein IGNPGNKH_00388 [Sodalis sp. Ffu]|nr:MAG: hypothetical protein IGNPGNKH_00388 [Sodalis sp. Ffu]